MPFATAYKLVLFTKLLVSIPFATAYKLVLFTLAVSPDALNIG